MFKTYRIETERLVIRCFEPRDAKLVREAIIDSLNELLPWMGWAKDEPETLESKIDRLRKYRGNFDLGTDYKFGIFSKDEKIFYGSIGIHIRSVTQKSKEIGYWANTKHSGKGYITEAVQALMKVGFNIDGLNKILFKCKIKNINSIIIPQRLGCHIVELKDKENVLFRMYNESYQKTNYSKINIKAFDVVGDEISTEYVPIKEEPVSLVKKILSYIPSEVKKITSEDKVSNSKYTNIFRTKKKEETKEDTKS